MKGDRWDYLTDDECVAKRNGEPPESYRIIVSKNCLWPGPKRIRRRTNAETRQDCNENENEDEREHEHEHETSVADIGTSGCLGPAIQALNRAIRGESQACETTGSI